MLQPSPCRGALAIELVPGQAPSRIAAGVADADSLSALVARDLARHAPQAAALDLGLACGLFDPAELLRPGFPVHAELERLLQLAPASAAGRIVAFGAHAGELPAGLRPDPAFAGPMRLLPFTLRGDAGVVADVAEAMEAVLLDTGMAGADTALLAQDLFGVRIEHARYLTVHDLAAMTAMHYAHAGLGPLWPLVEAALLSPKAEQWLDAPPEPMLRYAAGEARIALLDAEAWLTGGFAPAEADATKLERAYEHFQMRQRQFALVLEAHGIEVVYAHCPPGQDVRTVLRG